MTGYLLAAAAAHFLGNFGGTVELSTLLGRIGFDARILIFFTFTIQQRGKYIDIAATQTQSPFMFAEYVPIFAGTFLFPSIYHLSLGFCSAFILNNPKNLMEVFRNACGTMFMG